MAPSKRTAFRRDLCLASEAVQSSVAPSCAAAANNHWKRWVEFCGQLEMPPIALNSTDNFDVIPFLQVFAQRYRTGELAPSGWPVRARTVEDAICAISQTMATVAKDPRLTTTGKQDFCISCLWRSWKRIDSPPNHVKPIPLRVLRQLVQMAHDLNSPQALAFADMIVLAFFFLLRPGEYTGTLSQTTPSCLRDIQLFVNPIRIDHLHTPQHSLASATFATLEFTNQKNSVRGEVIGLGRTDDTLLCPVGALGWRILHLCSQGAPPDTPLGAYYLNGTLTRVSPTMISSTLQATVATFNSNELGFTARDVSARSLRAGGGHGTSLRWH